MEHPDGVRELLIRAPQEKTARRTRHLLVAARLSFVFSHGALAITTSAALGLEADLSWWAVFIPVWLGDSLCGFMCVASWFASCPYVQLCLAERQARLGDTNPSILTEILPDIVWAIMGFFLVCLALFGELLLCRSLELRQLGEKHELWPSATIFIVASFLTCIRGILVRTNGEFFGFFGAAVLITTAVALFKPADWVLVLPSVISILLLLMSTVRDMRQTSLVLTREERLLRIAEQTVMSMVAVILAALAAVLAADNWQKEQKRSLDVSAAVLGAVAGAGVCTLAALRARMALLESRQGSIAERMLAANASPDLLIEPVNSLREAALAAAQAMCADTSPSPPVMN